MTQSASVYDDLTVVENLAFFARVLRAELWGLFHRLAEAAAAVLVSSHVMDEAARCDRLLLMREGRIIADDPPAAILAATGATDMEAAFLRLVDAS